MNTFISLCYRLLWMAFVFFSLFFFSFFFLFFFWFFVLLFFFISYLLLNIVYAVPLTVLWQYNIHVSLFISRRQRKKRTNLVWSKLEIRFIHILAWAMSHEPWLIFSKIITTILVTIHTQTGWIHMILNIKIFACDGDE